MANIQYQRIHPLAKMPTRATQGSAGYDLYACLDVPLEVAPHERVKVPTGLKIAIPDASVGGFIFARSGLATKFGMGLPNSVGVIDSDYRGEILVAMVNNSDAPYTIQPGDRIAQMVFLPVIAYDFLEAETLDETSRGEGGFGSTSR